MKIDIMPKDTNFAFNLSHIRVPAKEAECHIKKLSPHLLSQVITFLPAKEALQLNLVSSFIQKAVTEHWDHRLAMFVAEIENQKIFSSDSLF